VNTGRNGLQLSRWWGSCHVGIPLEQVRATLSDGDRGDGSSAATVLQNSSLASAVHAPRSPTPLLNPVSHGSLSASLAAPPLPPSTPSTPILATAASRASTLLSKHVGSSSLTAAPTAAAHRRPRSPRVGPSAGTLGLVAGAVAVLLAAAAHLSTTLVWDWRPFLAGGLSAALSHGVATPFDVIKTRMQTNADLYDGSIVRAYHEIVRHEGAGFLLSGLLPTVVGYGVEGALKFGVYEVLKPMLHAATSIGWISYLGAGVAAGLLASLVLCPAEDARIRMVADPCYAQDGLVKACVKLYHDEGIAATYAGFWAMNVKQIPYTVTKQCSFDFLTAMAYSTLCISAMDHVPLFLGAAIPLAAALCTSVLSAVASQPGDVLLTATYKDGNHRGGLKDVYSKGGLAAFFVGTKARLLHVGTIITIQLVAYNLFRQLFGLAAAGR